MSRRFRIRPRYPDEFHDGKHRFEHWYRDNTVYFITARTRDGYKAFASEEAKAVFWDRFTHYSSQYGYVPWVTSIVENQSVRHKLCKDWRDYPHTRAPIDVDRGVKRALELKAFLEDVSYPRYERRSSPRRPSGPPASARGT